MRMRPVTALALTSVTPGFARQRAVDQPGAGGAAHAVGEQGDLAAAIVDGARVFGLHFLAIPQRQRAVVGIDAGAGSLAQAVVVVEVGVLDPLRGRRAAIAAEPARRRPRAGASRGAAGSGSLQWKQVVSFAAAWSVPDIAARVAFIPA